MINHDPVPGLWFC